MSCARVKVWPGREANVASRLNSMGVRGDRLAVEGDLMSC